jgi:hypothetical protein
MGAISEATMRCLEAKKASFAFALESNVVVPNEEKDSSSQRFA